MTDLYLVAHKVRDEPAFDVAIHMTCPECNGTSSEMPIGCHECDGLGYWWIIPTSGHRAYPHWNMQFDDLAVGFIWEDVPPPPSSLQDHYRTREEPRLDLAKALGLKSKPLPPIVRRL